MVMNVSVECHQKWCAELGYDESRRAALEASLDKFFVGPGATAEGDTVEWIVRALNAQESGEDTGSGMYAIDWNRPVTFKAN